MTGEDEGLDYLMRLRKMADAEDGCEIGVGGLAVDLGLYKAPIEENDSTDSE